VALSKEASHPDVFDPLFVFQKSNSGWNSTVEHPRETDILVFEDGGAGHFVVAKGAKLQPDGTLNIPIIEENVDAVGNYGPGGSCYNRVLVATKDAADKWNVGSGIGDSYKFTGFIRHNLAGIYGDNGWHVGGTSQAFRDAYNATGFGAKLGWAFANGKDGTPFVH
jgi:hypothetical protein